MHRNGIIVNLSNVPIKQEAHKGKEEPGTIQPQEAALGYHLQCSMTKESNGKTTPPTYERPGVSSKSAIFIL